MTTATPAKLRNGTWGAKVEGRVSVGDSVRITTRAGKSWDATVQRVVWSGAGVSLCATQSSSGGRGNANRSRSRGTWTGCACGSIEEHERSGDCWTCCHDR